MRSGTRQVHYQSWQQLTQAVKQLVGEPHRFQNQLKNIIISAFGSDTHKGLISNRISFYYQKPPVYWAQEIDVIVKMFQPKSQLLQGQAGIIASAEQQVSIEVNILPKALLNQFPPRGDKVSSILKGLKRERGQQYFVNIWQWFWIHIAYSLFNLPEVQQSRSLTEQEQEDQMFYVFSRNPILLIVRKALLHNYSIFRENNLIERIRVVFEIFVVQSLINSTRPGQSISDYRYQLKSHHMNMMFLLVYSRRTSLKDPILSIYHQYFQRAAQNFAKLSSERNTNINIRNLIRTWLFFITREKGQDHLIIKQLQKANPDNGWYRLERCPFQNWINAAKKIEISTKESSFVTATRNNIYNLLKKHNEWNPSFSLLTVLERFVQFDKVKLTIHPKRPQQKYEDQTLHRCFQRILAHLAQNEADCALLQTIQKRLNERFLKNWQKKIDVNFAERSQQAKQKLSRTNREKSKSMSYQNPRIKSVWQHPLQQNEFSFLLEGSRWVATKVDKLIPGHSKRTHPFLNFRVFANPLFFLLFFGLLAYAVYFFLK